MDFDDFFNKMREKKLKNMNSRIKRLERDFAYERILQKKLSEKPVSKIYKLQQLDLFGT
jgi:hypothetical protein